MRMGTQQTTKKKLMNLHKGVIEEMIEYIHLSFPATFGYRNLILAEITKKIE